MRCRRGIAAGTLALLFAAQAGAQNRGEELVLWHSYRAGEAAALEATVESFRRAHPDQAVRILSVPVGAYANKLRNSIPYGHGPDLFIIAHDGLGDLVARKLIDALPSVAQSDQFLSKTLAPLRLNQTLWGWPISYKSLVLFYRTDRLAKPPRTTDEMIAQSRALIQQGDYGLVYETGAPYYFAPWLYGFGGRLLNPAGTDTAFDSPEAVAAGEFLARICLIEKIVPADVNGALVTEMFNRGQAAMVIKGPWFVSEIAEGVPFAVAELPVVSATGRYARPFLTVEALFVARGKSRPEVLALAEHLTGDPSARQRVRLAGQPVANKRLYDDPAIAADPLLAVFKRQLENSEPMPTAPLTHLVWEPMAEGLRQIGRGALAPEVALRHTKERIAILNRDLPPEKSALPYQIVLFVGVAVLLAIGLFWIRRGLAPQILAARGAYAMVAPAAIGMTLMVGVPFVMGIGLGFYAYGVDEIRFVGLANFFNILAADDYALTHPMSFYFTLVVTFLWTLLNVFLHVAVGFAIAVLLNQPWLWGRGLFRVALILPWAIPSYISALVFKGLFNKQLGAINALLGAVGLEPVGWFDSFVPSFTANLTTNVWLGFPFMMVTIMGALQAVPVDLYAAARIDGAGPVRRFLWITLPQVAPALVPAIILGTLWTFNMFNVVYLVSEGQPEGATDILVTEAYRWAFERNGRYGYAAAYSLVIFVILFVYTMATRRLTQARKA